jgi:tetratricopeptide (TPR) repeat protein
VAWIQNIALNFGGTIRQSNVVISPEQFQQLAEVASGSAVQTAKIEELATKLGATQASLLAMVRLVLGQDNIPVERLPDAFGLAMTQILNMREKLSRPSNEGSDIAELRQLALSALDAGRFDEATRILKEIRALEQNASERRRRAAEEGRKAWLAGLHSEAETCALLALAALTLRDVTAALNQFEEGLGLLAPGDTEHRWSYAFEAAAALYELGRAAGLNDALAAAIRLYGQALAAAPRERVPLDWAVTQNNLGNALAILGERENGAGHLKRAVAAYRAALQERTRERVPLDWAMTQSNLGNALSRLDGRESGTARLEQAVTAFRKALQERARERVPLLWAATQSNLGEALTSLGERESGTARLEEAVAALRAALQEFTAETTPDWHDEAQRHLTRCLALLEQRCKK